MDFLLNEKHKAMQKLFKQFSEEVVKPMARRTDEEERFPIEAVEQMKELKMFGINTSKEYGGSGADYISYILAVMELSKVCATTGVVLSAHNSLCVDPITKYGTQEQKDKYLHKLATGEYLGAFALTEPDAGTDAASQKSVATKCGEDYVLNGSKIFITNAGYADVYIVFALTEPSLGTRGISAFILEKGMKGFSIGKKELKMGIRGSATCELHFDHVLVPKENLLGRVNKGFGVALGTLDGGRIGIAAQALGIAYGAIDETVKYVKERKQFNRSISKFQNTQFVLADLLTKTEAAALMVIRAATLKQNGKPFSKESAMAKLLAAETAMEVTTKCLQLFGGYGYTREYPIERMMRDAKITEIYEGTSEVQKMVISSYMLK